uniref:Lipocalin-5 1 n=1 Tax=Elaeophora elaphi TaxID=1147741 RepID=A0A0R3RIM0_9BILA
MNLLHYSVLLTLLCWPGTSLLDFPRDNIRRLPALDIIGGYPSFFGAIYVFDDHGNANRIRPESNRFVPLSTVLHFTIKNDPNCTIEQRSSDEGNLLKAATMFEKESIGDYVHGDEVRTNGQLSLLRPDASGLCTHLYKQTVKYKVNYTTSCLWHFNTEKGCDVNDLVRFLSNQINGTEVCDQTGNQCIVPILRDMATISSDQKCDNYSVMNVHLATQQGSILGALIE